MVLKKIPEKHDATIYEGRRNWYIVGFVAALLTIVATSFIARQHRLEGWELDIFRFINNWSDSWQDFFRAITLFHDSLWIAVIMVVLAFVFRMWRLAWRMAASTFGGYALTLLLKEGIDRARPEGLLKGAVEQVHLRWIDVGAGFPSGHTMIITVVMLTLLPYIPGKWRWVVPIPIILMALSRIYLGSHAPLDVVGGFAVGVFIVSCIRIMPQSLRVFLRLD